MPTTLPLPLPHSKCEMEGLSLFLPPYWPATSTSPPPPPPSPRKGHEQQQEQQERQQERQQGQQGPPKPTGLETLLRLEPWYVFFLRFFRVFYILTNLFIFKRIRCPPPHHCPSLTRNVRRRGFPPFLHRQPPNHPSLAFGARRRGYLQPPTSRNQLVGGFFGPHRRSRPTTTPNESRILVGGLSFFYREGRDMQNGP